MKYSPFYEVCAALANPVAALAMVTFALEMLPPDVSKILPDSVAVMACPFAIGAETPINANKHATQTAGHTKDGLIRFITLTPKRAEAPEWRGVYQNAPSEGAVTYAVFTLCRRPNPSRRGSTSSRK